MASRVPCSPTLSETGTPGKTSAISYAGTRRRAGHRHEGTPPGRRQPSLIAAVLDDRVAVDISRAQQRMPLGQGRGECSSCRPGGRAAKCYITAPAAPSGRRRGVADVGRPAVPGAAWPGADRRPPPSPGLCPGARRWKGATLHPDQPAHWHLEALGVRQCTEPICTTASVLSASSSPRRNPVRARNSTTSPDERPGARGAAPGTWGRRWRRRSGAAARRGWAGHRRTREVWRGQFS
jgi:hypothetical protein